MFADRYERRSQRPSHERFPEVSLTFSWTCANERWLRLTPIATPQGGCRSASETYYADILRKRSRLMAPKHHHKHHHRHGPMGDIDGELDASSSDADEADDGEDAGVAEEAEAALYGVEITGLYKGTAAKEGMEVGDIILNFNGTPTPTFEALADAVARSGSQAQVLVSRGDGGERETTTLFPQDGRIGLSGEPVRVNE